MDNPCGRSCMYIDWKSTKCDWIESEGGYNCIIYLFFNEIEEPWFIVYEVSELFKRLPKINSLFITKKKVKEKKKTRWLRHWKNRKKEKKKVKRLKSNWEFIGSKPIVSIVSTNSRLLHGLLFSLVIIEPLYLLASIVSF